MTVHAPTEVDFFHVGKKFTIQAAYFPKGIHSEGQTGSACPENWPVDRQVILSLIFFALAQDSPVGKGNAPPVHESAHGAGVLEFGLFAVVAQLGLYCPKFWVLNKTIRQGLKPTHLGLDVGIHEHCEVVV